MRPGTRRRFALLLRVVFAGAALATVLGSTSGSVLHNAPLLGAFVSAVISVIGTVIVGGAIFGAEIFLPRTRLGLALERAPFLLTSAVKLLVYVAVVATSTG